MIKKLRRFRGGYTFKKPKAKLAEVQDITIPEKVVLPLKLRFGSTIKPLVAKGDQVTAGRIIARDDETISTPAISSVNGVVEDIVKLNYFYGTVDAMVIRSDGVRDYQPVPGAQADFENLTFEKISELIYVSGAASLSKSGIPTIYKSSPARPKSIDNLIITTFNSGPFSLHERSVFEHRQRQFYKGLHILKRALPNIKVSIAMDHRDRKFKKEMIDAIRRGSPTVNVPDWISIQLLDKKYPQASEEMLVRTILNKKIPLAGLGTDIGVLILDIQDVIRVYEAVCEGKPLIEHTVALVGSACKENKFINVRVGTALEEVLKGNLKEGVEPRAIFGTTMTGIIQPDLSMPIGRSINRITVLAENKAREFLSFLKPGSNSNSYSRAFLSTYLPGGERKYDTNLNGELRPCIQCGYCDEVCPVGIIPHLLDKQIKHGLCEESEKLGIFECIDCGLCSYVCPCKISLADNITTGKRTLIEEGCSVPRVKAKESEEAAKAYRGRMPL